MVPENIRQAALARYACIRNLSASSLLGIRISDVPIRAIYKLPLLITVDQVYLVTHPRG